MLCILYFFFFQAEDGIRDAQESRGLGDVYKRQVSHINQPLRLSAPKSVFWVEAEGALVVDPYSPGKENSDHVRVTLSAEHVCVLRWSNSNIAHWTFDNLVMLAACYRVNAKTLVLTWNNKMRPWHLELLSHAFKGTIVRLVPSNESSVVAPQGVFVPCMGTANDAPWVWWRTGKESCRHNHWQRDTPNIWVVLDQMRASLHTDAKPLEDQVDQAGALLFGKRTDSGSGRHTTNLPEQVKTLEGANYSEWNPLAYHSFAARMASLRDTRQLVLETGSDMIQTLFMPTGSTLVVLANPLMYVKVAFAKAVAIGFGLNFVSCNDVINIEWGHGERVKVQVGRNVTYIDSGTHQLVSEILSQEREFEILNPEVGLRMVDSVDITRAVIEDLVARVSAMTDEAKWMTDPHYFDEVYNDLGMSLGVTTFDFSFDPVGFQRCLNDKLDTL
eukprot:TRINITY_DN4665_c0_g1_i4.p1 TRINITY_DN4665_c0_g1~~TRINITY_DN4665_c0_g1_i4.p1  ORF type:complete len:444 (+),score=71.04 TRINITY_DN4665_c0_g1_i4:100-1431(+)